MPRFAMVAIFLLVGLAGGTVALGQIPGRTSFTVGGDSDWGDFPTLADLMSRTEIVIVGTLLSERIETVEIPSNHTDEVLVRTDVVRSYRISEVVAGRYEPSLIETRVARSYRFHNSPIPRAGGALDIVDLQIGAEYVLSLRWYQPEAGPAHCGQPGEPATAIRVGDDLLFVASERFQRTREEAGLTHPSPGSAAPFRATLSAVRALAANGWGG